MNLRLIVLLQISCVITAEIKNCNPCDCRKTSGNLSIAKCSGSHQFPRLNRIPSTIESHINVLDFRDQSFKILENNSFAFFNNLKIINFDNNSIEKVGVHAFKGLSRLIKIILSHNEIKTLPDGIFFNLKNLEDVNLSNNNIVFLQRLLFSNLPKLAKITLSFNKLNRIDKDCFSNLPSLKQVFLQDNKLTTLQISIIDNPIYLEHFYLNGNQWHCDEELCSLLEYLSHEKMYMTCESPAYLKNKTWNELKSDGYSLSSTSQSQSVAKGETAQLECEYCLINKTKTINWNYNPGRSRVSITQNDFSFIKTSTLILQNVSESDIGFYSCYTDDSSTCNVSIFLNVYNNFSMLPIFQNVYNNFSNLTDDNWTINGKRSNQSTITRIDLTILYISAGASILFITIFIIVGVCVFYRKEMCSKNTRHKATRNEPFFSFLEGDDPVPFTPPESVARTLTRNSYNSRTNTRTIQNRETDHDNNSTTLCCGRVKKSERNFENNSRNDTRGRSSFSMLAITEL